MNSLSPVNSWLKVNEKSIEPDRQHQQKDQELRRVSKEFEAIIVKTMIKEGFQSARKMGGEEDSDQGSKQFMDMALEQMADHMAKNVGFGLKDVIYESLKQKL